MKRQWMPFAVGSCVLWAVSACNAKGDEPGIIVLPNMVESIPFDAYDPNPVTPLGQTLLRPPLGTVPSGWPIFAFGPGPDEAARAGREIKNPLLPTEPNAVRGSKLFATYCQVCHGPKGMGDGPIIGRFPQPPSLIAEHARGLLDGQIFHIISYGQGIMPSHGAQILPIDRWRIVFHVRTLQEKRP
jgi:mono/diheme cytochrome c family protein